MTLCPNHDSPWPAGCQNRLHQPEEKSTVESEGLVIEYSGTLKRDEPSYKASVLHDNRKERSSTNTDCSSDDFIL